MVMKRLSLWRFVWSPAVRVGCLAVESELRIFPLIPRIVRQLDASVSLMLFHSLSFGLQT
jgi:hypothetical protein